MNRAEYLISMFSLEGQVAIVTGGTGALGSAMAKALAMAGARVGVLSRGRERSERVVSELRAFGGEALALTADVLDRDSLVSARDTVVARWGSVTTLVNAAGGNLAAATIPEGGDIFQMSPTAFQQVVDLNLTGTLLPSLVFGQTMVEGGSGSIVNVSSMASSRALTRVAGYGAAKSAVENLTRWLAVELGRRYGGAIRVNAIAPGFFIGAQNRDLLLEPDGTPTARARTIVAHTPVGRFGEADDLMGALVWLCSPSARFVNGIVLPVDGGFSAFGGV
ncbi:MAG TPA: SDR family oxidoreductase [Candidatus Eisenbacteria bacterium]|nr:SDR family oxidoreductase [Candidatus Eisenbacteria bacterium]